MATADPPDPSISSPRASARDVTSVGPTDPPEIAAEETVTAETLSFWTVNRTSWLIAVLVAAAISSAMGVVMLTYPIPPGGDPGTWLSTSYAFIGRSYPSQVIPFGYPPALFPLLGLAVVATGSPTTAALATAVLLDFGLGLSIFYLATLILRSRVVALCVMTFLLLDPQIDEMFFWGAYPNLLAFIFMTLALAGLVSMGHGRLSRGALVFWIFGALAVLTHSLTGLVLAGTTLLFLLLTWPMPMPTRSQIRMQAAAGEIDVPRIIPNGLFLSRGGKLGVIGFAIAIGAYYVATALAHLPHPDYLASNALAFKVVGLGPALKAVLPGVRFSSLGVVYLLIGLTIAILAFYGAALLRRRALLTTPVILLSAMGITVMMVPIVGWLFQIVTDYGRFGYFLLIPLGLAIGYLIDRGWVTSRSDAESIPAETPTPDERRPLTQRWLRTAPHPRRVVTVAVTGFVLALLVAGSLTGPGLTHWEFVFTRVGHDQNFLDALDAIQKTGLPGSIMTIPGADKWARAITDRNAYAPYAQSTYLFYGNQILDSDLSYYALNSHYAVTNGLATGSLRGTAPGNAIGIPTYGVYVVGAFHPILEVSTAYSSVELVSHTSGAAYSENLTGSPQVIVPPPTSGAPLEIVYTGPGFVLTVSVAAPPGSPSVSVAFDLVATGLDHVRALNLTVMPSASVSAHVYPGSFPGSFKWDSVATFVGPLTLGNVTPTSAFLGVTSLDPQTSSPAALLSYPPSGTNGTNVITGTLTLTTPIASTLVNVLPPIIVTPDVWRQLGLRFLLLKTVGNAIQPGVANPQEIPYLESEYGCTLLYKNTGWTVLQVPPTL